VVLPIEVKADIPIEVVTINKDSIADYKSDATYSYNDGLEIQVFIYEEPSAAYWKNKNQLDQCWKKMKCIHFILPNLLEIGQAATPKQASVPHYQTTLAQIKLEIKSFHACGGVVKFMVYKPDQNYSKQILHVVNSSLLEIASIDWQSLVEVAYQEVKVDKK
jgi:hypothetical protein